MINQTTNGNPNATLDNFIPAYDQLCCETTKLEEMKKVLNIKIEALSQAKKSLSVISSELGSTEAGLGITAEKLSSAQEFFMKIMKTIFAGKVEVEKTMLSVEQDVETLQIKLEAVTIELKKQEELLASLKAKHEVINQKEAQTNTKLLEEIKIVNESLKLLQEQFSALKVEHKAQQTIVNQLNKEINQQQKIVNEQSKVVSNLTQEIVDADLILTDVNCCPSPVQDIEVAMLGGMIESTPEIATA